MLCLQVCWYHFTIFQIAHRLTISFLPPHPDTYYLAFPHDRLHAKIQVYAVLVIELVQSAVVAHDVAISLAVGGLENLDVAFDLASEFRTSLDSIHGHWFSIPLAGGIGECIFYYLMRPSLLI